MKAVLLVAGVGKRLFPLTQTSPKCLLPIGRKPLLQIYLEAFEKIGIQSMALVVGHLREKIESFAGHSWKGIPVTYYESPDTRGGSLLSLWSARGELNDDCLIMDGDVFFPDILLERLIRSKHPNCLLADPSSPNTGEEQVLYGENGRVFFISKKPHHAHKPIGESVGFLKLSKAAACELKNILEEFIAAGKKGIEHEDTYPPLMQRHEIRYETVDDLKWTEIDSMEDLRRAEKFAGKT